MKDINGTPSEDLKKTLLGRDNYLFLINDSSQELNQHFNPDFESEFDPKSFLDNYNFKKELFSKYYDYHFFVVPDKSVVCKEFLPFKTDYLKRNIDIIDDNVDFVDYLDKEDYFKFDTHISFKGGEKLSFLFLNQIDNNFTIEEYNNLINNVDKIEIERLFDLVHEKNWSYSQDFKDNFKLTEIFTVPKPKGLKEITDFPDIFKYCGIRQSVYYKNEESYSDLRVLIFGDSTFKLLSPYLSLYFKELFFYWDHGLFNINLINWFNPDLILEIRIERFLDSIPVPDWIINKEDVDLSSDALVENLFNTTYKLSNELNEVKEKYKEVNNNLKRANNKLTKVNNKLTKVTNEKEKYIKLNHEKDIFIEDILNSNSWKITKPLRKIKNLK